MTEQTITTNTPAKNGEVSASHNEVPQGTDIGVEKPLELTLNTRRLFYLFPTIVIGLFLIYVIKRPISNEENESALQK